MGLYGVNALDAGKLGVFVNALFVLLLVRDIDKTRAVPLLLATQRKRTADALLRAMAELYWTVCWILKASTASPRV